MADPTGCDGNLVVAPGFLAATYDNEWTNDDIHLGSGSVVKDMGSRHIIDTDGSRSIMGPSAGVSGAGSLARSRVDRQAPGQPAPMARLTRETQRTQIRSSGSSPARPL
jgi:hypothetical protein